MHPLDLAIIVGYLVLITFVGLRLAAMAPCQHDAVAEWWRELVPGQPFEVEYEGCEVAHE